MKTILLLGCLFGSLGVHVWVYGHNPLSDTRDSSLVASDCLAYWQLRSEGLSREGGMQNKLLANQYLQQHSKLRDRLLQTQSAQTLATHLYQTIADQLLLIDHDYAQSHRLDSRYRAYCNSQ